MAVWAIRWLALWVVAAVVVRAALAPAETCPPATAADLRSAVAEAADWLERGQRSDGRFTYGYDRDRDELASGYNTTRHAGVVAVLYAVGRAAPADRGLGWMRRNLVHHGGWTALAPAGEPANVGANALLLAGLVNRRRATGEHTYDALARRVARFIASQVQPDGSVLQYWDPGSGRPVVGLHGRWSTGEAFWALALADRLFPADGWGSRAQRVGRYLATRRDVAEGNRTRLPDHWAAYGLDALGRERIGPVELAYARRLAGYFGALTRVESQRQAGGVALLVRGGTNSGAGMGTAGEGAAALWRLAGTEPRLADLREPLGERLRCLGGILVERQVEREEAASAPRPELVRGAWFDDGYTQMDDQQHAISALLGALAALR